MSGYVGNAGDSLANTTVAYKWNLNGMNFSTYDEDNDGNPTLNCARQYLSGWWHNNCFLSCLTCKLNNFMWRSLLGLNYEPDGRLQAARMMIKSNIPD